MDESMVDSVFDVSDGSSDAFSPEPKPVKAKAAAKKAAPAAAPKARAPPKKMTQTTLKPKVPSKKRSKPQSDEENSDVDEDPVGDASLLSNTPPSAKRQKKALPPKMSSGKPLQPIANESFGVDGAADEAPKTKPKGKASTSAEQYQMLTQLQHILKRPDTYIGSVERTESKMWVYNSETESMESREVSYVPGLYKIFDEILVNAADNKIRDPKMNKLEVTIDKEKGMISVRNNGRGIPIEIHEKEQIFIPEMIFGHLLTSSNYNDNEQKVTGGRNGYGAKLCNVYSTEFTLETVDSNSGKKYKQTWTDNMSKMGKAIITSHKGDDFTKVTFKPDFKKFGMDEIDTDFEALVKRRVYDLAGTCKDVKVSLNGEQLKVRNFKKYMEMYTKAIKTENTVGDEESKKDLQVILTDNPHERWEIGFAVSDGSFQQVSFVNSIATTSGGTHVNYIADQIITKLSEIVKKKNKRGVQLTSAQIRNHIFLFVNCQITNPSFTSQTKEQLTTKASQFGSKCTVSEKFLKDISKTEAVDNIIHFAERKGDQVLKKSDGNRRTRMNHSKLTDANKAGTKDGHRCTLILTEGDSASLLALAGRAIVDPDLIGVFPLRGKLLNVRDASIDQISKNQEIQNIKKFMGLQHKRVYEDTKSLRYGHLMIMTDQDHDGSHIKGLLINFLESSFPSLLKIPGFLQEFITPIVKVWKGDVKNPKKLQSFFTMPEYEAWKQLPGNTDGWDHKYFKGLGTSEPSKDAQVYFRDLDKHLKEFATIRKNEEVDEPEMIDLAFSKKKADARKEWLRQFRPGTYLDMSAAKITYDDFINKELILFSMADNLRSIPSVIDGFKPGQRKVLYTCFRRNLKKDVKVVELAGSVSGLTAYAYGDTSLQGTIVGIAQNFVGSNNINCLEPSGNFGSRLQGGQDCASARYIYTRLSPLARKIFQATDEPLLTYNLDDGKTIEPETYIPILPMILVNGADGIGTGWSTSIPNYNPVDIVENLRLRMAGTSKDDMKPMKPWFRGWKNEVEELGGDRFKFSGTINQTGENEVEITELPVRTWTQDFKDRLEEILKAEKTPSFIKDYTEYNTPEKVHFIIKLDEKNMKGSILKGLEETFKLSKTMATTNLVAFDGQGRIQKYASVLDILEEFYHIRLKFYAKRKEYLLNEMNRELERFTNQARFVRMIVDGDLVVNKKKKSVLVEELRAKGFKPIPKVKNAQKEGEFEPVVEKEDEEEADETPAVGANDFDYLLGMAIWSLTEERIEKLMKQIGDKEIEIDTLIKTSEKQLWSKDLDDFLAEWQFQLDDEAKRTKKYASQGRRASAKLRIGGKGGNKKRKADSDDDSSFDAGKPKPIKPKASDALKRLMDGNSKPDAPKPKAKPKAGLLGSIEQIPTAKPPAEQQGLIRGETTGHIVNDDDDAVIKTVSAYNTKAPSEKVEPKRQKKSRIIEEDESEGDMFLEMTRQPKPKDTATAPAAAKPPAREGRAASRKPVQYTIPDESGESDSDGNFDVGNMVKGIGDTNVTSGTSKPLFSNSASASRPGSSHSVTKSRPSKLPTLSDEDETDYKNLVPRDSPVKAAARNAREAAGSDDDDILLDNAPKRPPLKTTSKPATSKASKPLEKPKKEFVEPAPAQTQEKKVPGLSPAAKAYAMKQAKAKAAMDAGIPPPAQPKLGAVKKAPSAAKKAKKTIDSDDDIDSIANDLLKDSDDEADDSRGVVTARPTRRAASTQPASKSKYVVDDEDEDEDEESEVDEDDSDDEVVSDDEDDSD